MSTPLTDAAVRKIAKNTVLADGTTGLRVQRGKTDVVSWFYRRNIGGGKKKRYALGKYPEVSLLDARNALRELKLALERGEDVAKPKPKVKTRYRVSDLVEDYLSKFIVPRRKPKGAAEVSRMLNKYVVPEIGDLAAEAIKPQDILRIANIELEKGNHTQAGNILRELRNAFEQAAVRGDIDYDLPNPVAPVISRLGSSGVRLTSRAGTTVLADEDLKLFNTWLFEPGNVSPNHRRVLFLTLRLGVRSGEACDVRWSDIDLEKGVWTLTETKTGQPRNIILPRQVLEFLKADRMLNPSNVYVAQSTHPASKNKPIGQGTLTEAFWGLREKKKWPFKARFSPHDLRRTMRTGLSKLGIREEVCEAAIGHSKKGVAGVYDLYRYEKEVGEALLKWNDYLDALN